MSDQEREKGTSEAPATAPAREAALGKILDVISRSRDDEQPVFDAILENAARLCNAPIAFLSLASEDRTQVLIPAHRGTRSEFGSILDGFVEPISRTELVAVRPIVDGLVVREDDIKDHDTYRSGDPRRRQMVDVEGARSVLGVPLISGGTPVGAIILYRREVLPFGEDDVSLIENFAAQAVIAIENVRQFRELQARLKREEASREILGVISESRDDEKPVFRKILQKAVDLCTAQTAGLNLLNTEQTHLDVIDVIGATGSHFAPGSYRTDMQDATSNMVICVNEARTVAIADLADTDGYRSRKNAQRVILVEEYGIRSWLAVPLVRDGVAIGCLGLFRTRNDPFTADEITLVETFAAQAVIAIENVRQFRELQTRLEREAATREVLQVISRSRDDEAPVFRSILAKAADLCGAPMARLHLVNDERTEFRVVAFWGDAPLTMAEGDSWPLDPEITMSRTLVDGETLHLEDHAKTENYLRGDPIAVKIVEEEGIRTRLSVPLLRDRVPIGSITLSRREVKPFTDDQISLVETFAAQAVIAIENVRQFKALEALNAELGDRVEEQVGEIERMGRLKRFLSPAVADAVVSQGAEAALKSHRALLGILFCDIRGFTAFCETAEPEETIEVLQTYHEEMGKLISEHGGGVDKRMGDGIMVLFNDPLPCDDPAGQAFGLARAMHARMRELCQGWRRMGHRLGFGSGIALGYATVGMVGSEGRYDYTASGTAVNLAARLCDTAEDGEILLSPRAFIALEDRVEAEAMGALDLKGIAQPVEVMKVDA